MSRITESTNANASERKVFDDNVCLEFILSIENFGFDSFINDSRTRAVAAKTNCHVELTPRILNKRINLYRWSKYAIVKVTGPDEGSINQCLTLLERQFPNFSRRKEYSRRANVTMFTNDITFPDNTPGATKMVRSASTMSYCRGLVTKSPFINDEIRTVDKTVWKATKSDFEGNYTTSFLKKVESLPPLPGNVNKFTTVEGSLLKLSRNENFGKLGNVDKDSKVSPLEDNANRENVTVRVAYEIGSKEAKGSQTSFEMSTNVGFQEVGHQSRSPRSPQATANKLQQPSDSNTFSCPKSNKPKYVICAQSQEHLGNIQNMYSSMDDRKKRLPDKNSKRKGISDSSEDNKKGKLVNVGENICLGQDGTAIENYQPFSLSLKIVMHSSSSYSDDHRSENVPDSGFRSTLTVKTSSRLEDADSRIPKNLMTLAIVSSTSEPTYDSSHVLKYSLTRNTTNDSGTTKVSLSIKHSSEMKKQGESRLTMNVPQSLGAPSPTSVSRHSSDDESNVSVRITHNFEMSNMGEYSKRGTSSESRPMVRDTNQISIPSPPKMTDTSIREDTFGQSSVSVHIRHSYESMQDNIVGERSRALNYHDSDAFMKEQRPLVISSPPQLPQRSSKEESFGGLHIAISVKHSSESTEDYEGEIRSGQRTPTDQNQKKQMAISSPPQISLSSSKEHLPGFNISVGISHSSNFGNDNATATHKGKLQAVDSSHMKQAVVSPKQITEKAPQKMSMAPVPQSITSVSSVISVSDMDKDQQSRSTSISSISVIKISKNVTSPKERFVLEKEKVSPLQVKPLEKIKRISSENESQPLPVKVHKDPNANKRAMIADIQILRNEKSSESNLEVNVQQGGLSNQGTYSIKGRMSVATQSVGNTTATKQSSRINISDSVSHDTDEKSTNRSLPVQNAKVKTTKPISPLPEVYKSIKSSEGLLHLSDSPKVEMEFKRADDTSGNEVLGKMTNKKQNDIQAKSNSYSSESINVKIVSGVKTNISKTNSSETVDGVYLKGVNKFPTHSKLRQRSLENELSEKDIADYIAYKLANPESGTLILLFEGLNIYSAGKMNSVIRPKNEKLENLNFNFESTKYIINAKGREDEMNKRKR